MENNDVLMHYGRKGMKWYQSIYGGVNKIGGKTKNKKGSPQQSKDATSAKKEQTEQKRKEQREQAKKEALSKGSASDILKYKGELTNDEMKKAIDRLVLEKRLSELSDTKRVSKGKSAVTKWLKESSKKIAVDTSVDIASQLFKYYAVRGVNGVVGDTAVYTNNKRKS